MQTIGTRCWGIFDWLCKIWIILTNKRKTGDDCVYFPERIINRPDPCIYSQFLLMQLDQPVTWDNPDIALFLGGVEQYTYDLVTNTTYDVVITVHNSSRDKQALGTLVIVRWIEFGAGAQIRHPIASLPADVPVWPNTTNVTTSWLTPATPGHYCIEVELEHSNDGNPANNRGWNNTQVKSAHSTVETPIRIFNQWLAGQPGVARQATTGSMDEVPNPDRQGIPLNLVELTVDSYRFNDAKGKQANPDDMFAPRPPAWPARVEPRLFHFQQDETYRDVMLIVDAPDTAAEPEVFNVTARQGGVPTGGVTITVTREE